LETPTERRLAAQYGAHKSWENTDDRSARTLPARLKFEERFARQVDPDNRLAPAERAKRAESARKAYYKQFALKSVQARRRRARGCGSRP
jgi:hypothetical protein